MYVSSFYQISFYLSISYKVLFVLFISLTLYQYLILKEDISFCQLYCVLHSKLIILLYFHTKIIKTFIIYIYFFFLIYLYQVILKNNFVYFLDGGSKASNITNKLIFMIAKDNLSLSTVQKERFQAFMKRVSPLYIIPSRKMITFLMEEKYVYLLNLVKTNYLM